MSSNVQLDALRHLAAVICNPNSFQRKVISSHSRRILILGMSEWWCGLYADVDKSGDDPSECVRLITLN